jgi:RimJ/RimL family protein N-acetyltransferase
MLTRRLQGAPPIRTPRLDLIPLVPSVLRAALAGEHAAARRLLGLRVPAGWPENRPLAEARLRELEADPGLLPWFPRAIGLRARRAMAGTIGFHERPGAARLRDLAPGGAELGYEVFPAYRRRGIAREACLSLMDWAEREHGVTRFVVRVAPANQASRRLAQGLGFRWIGSRLDEVDGYEDVFVRVALPHPAWKRHVT